MKLLIGLAIHGSLHDLHRLIPQCRIRLEAKKQFVQIFSRTNHERVPSAIPDFLYQEKQAPHSQPNNRVDVWQQDEEHDQELSRIEQVAREKQCREDNCHAVDVRLAGGKEMVFERRIRNRAVNAECSK